MTLFIWLRHTVVFALNFTWAGLYLKRVKRADHMPRTKPLWLELHQQDWIPNFLKEIQLQEISPILSFIRYDKTFLELFAEWQKHIKTKEFVDLGSGSGNMIRYLLESNNGHFSEVHFTLTDLYPQADIFKKLKSKFPENLDYVAEKVDLSDSISVYRNKGVTILTTFHELSRSQADKTMVNLLQHSRGFLILEPLNKSWKQAVKIPGIFLGAVIAPFKIKPRRFTNFLFSCFIPIVPFFHLHDAWVSFLRSYTKRDFQGMLEKFGNKNWSWIVDNIGNDITYVMAWRKNET